MHAEAKRGLTRHFAGRITCLRHGHAWVTTELVFGEVSLLRTDCARCGRIGPLHGAQERARRAVADPSSEGGTPPR
jgi:hypothetical protein